jgi:hypothetical protein
MDTRQLALITDDESAASRTWRLDEHTREIGRQGVAAAREALRAALAGQRAEKGSTPHAA